MNAKERVLAIRLLEKAAQHPDYAKRLGIEVWMQEARQSGCEKERS